MSLKTINAVNSRHPKRVAIVLSNPAVSTTSGWLVGFWWSELTHPTSVLTEHGYGIEIFSPDGGKYEADAMSDPRDPSGYLSSDLISAGFIATPALMGLLEETKPVVEIDLGAFGAIVVAGGQAPMFTFEKALSLYEKFAAFQEAGKMVCALCHGSAVRRYAKKSDGAFLAKGKTVTGFANVEEKFAGNVVWDMNALPREQHVIPWRIEGELRALGANYFQAGLWRGFAIRDRNLLTGQQNFSGFENAESLVTALGE